MVQKHRSASKSSIAMDASTLRLPANKSDLSSSPRLGYKLEVPSRAAVKDSGSLSDPWHYNNMIKNKRQEFNNLHFC